MNDWLGETTFEMDLLDRIVSVNDHKSQTVGMIMMKYLIKYK